MSNSQDQEKHNQDDPHWSDVEVREVETVRFKRAWTLGKLGAKMTGSFIKDRVKRSVSSSGDVDPLEGDPHAPAGLCPFVGNHQVEPGEPRNSLNVLLDGARLVDPQPTLGAPGPRKETRRPGPIFVGSFWARVALHPRREQTSLESRIRRPSMTGSNVFNSK